MPRHTGFENMRIGVDANLLLGSKPGGVESYLAELVTRMPRIRRDHEFRLYFNHFRSRHRPTVARFARDPVQARVCRIPCQILTLLQWHFGLPVDWVVGRVDVMFYPSCFVLPQRSGRVVVTVHDLIPITHPELCESDHVRNFQARVPASLARADAVVVVSAYIGMQVRERFGLPAERIHIIPNGVHERFRPLEEPMTVAAIKRKYGIWGPYLLFVGTMEPRKNLLRLIEAFRQANRGAVRDHALVLAGKPAWGSAELQQALARVAPEARILLLEYITVDDLPALYSGATAFLFPSLAEGFGIPPVEAMSCGCPVLISDIPALREVTRGAALSVDPADVDAIAEGIRRLVEDVSMREALKARGLCLAKEFSWNRTAAETLRVLEATSAGR